MIWAIVAVGWAAFVGILIAFNHSASTARRRADIAAGCDPDGDR